MEPKELIQKGLEDLRDRAKDAGEKLADESEALGKAAVNTGEITIETAVALAKGDVDLEGALRVTRRASEQMESYAHAEGNLIAATLAGTLRSWGESLLKLVSVIGLPI